MYSIVNKNKQNITMIKKNVRRREGFKYQIYNKQIIIKINKLHLNFNGSSTWFCNIPKNNKTNITSYETMNNTIAITKAIMMRYIDLFT